MMPLYFDIDYFAINSSILFCCFIFYGTDTTLVFALAGIIFNLFMLLFGNDLVKFKIKNTL